MNIKNLSLAFLLTCCSSQNKLTLEEVSTFLKNPDDKKLLFKGIYGTNIADTLCGCEYSMKAYDINNNKKVDLYVYFSVNKEEMISDSSGGIFPNLIFIDLDEKSNIDYIINFNIKERQYKISEYNPK